MRRIASRRIGDNTTSTPHKPNRDHPWVWLVTGIMMALIAVAYIAIDSRFPATTNVVQITVVTTPTSIQALEPTITQMPTISPATLTPLSTIHLDRATVLAQVWLYDAPGGNRLPAGLLAGQYVTVLEYREDFVKVLWDGGDTAIVGWVAERWIKVQ